MVIASGAKVLGSFYVGDNSRIGANAVVLSAVPANSTVVGFKARVVKRDGVRVDRLDHANLPDPVVDMFRLLQDQINELNNALELRS